MAFLLNHAGENGNLTINFAWPNHHFIPSATYIFPAHTFGKQQRHFQRSWLTKYKGLVYSKSEIMYFWIRSNPVINKRKAHTPPLYSNIVWLSLHAQRKFHMDLSFSSIKLSGMKFLPSTSKTIWEAWLQ